MSHPTDLEQRLRAAVREVPDFPQPGIRFKDITPLLLNPALVNQAAQALAAPFLGQGITKVVGIESRGFIFGPLMAQHLGAGFVIVRKAGKLPPDVMGVSYDLEYGSATLEISRHVLAPSDRLLIHDDLLATGGTASAAAQLAHQQQAQVLGFSFLIGLEYLAGRQRLQALGPVVHTLLAYA